MKTSLFRLITGYVISFTVFLLVIPITIISVARRENSQRPVRANVLLSTVSIIIMGIGLTFYLSAHLYQLVVGRGGAIDLFNVAVSPRTKKLITTGPYSFSRNPMALGAILFYFGLSMYNRSLRSISALFLLLPIMMLYLKNVEEQRLIADFREEFTMYKMDVPFFFPGIRLRDCLKFF